MALAGAFAFGKEVRALNHQLICSEAARLPSTLCFAGSKAEWHVVKLWKSNFKALMFFAWRGRLRKNLFGYPPHFLERPF